MAKKNDPDGPLPKWGEPEGVAQVMKKTPGQKTKTIKVGEDTIGSSSPHYALVKEREVVAVGSKEEMLKLHKEEGGRVWLSTKNVGDIVEAKYSVDVEGLPRLYMDADSPAQIKKMLRTLLRKASSIDSVERVNDAKIKQDLRQRIKGADTDKRYVDEASLRMRIAARGRIETKLRKMKNDDADMAAFLINQDDQKELAKFLKSLDPKSRKAIEDVMKEGTDFAAQRAKPRLTQSDHDKMRKVAQMLAKERQKKAMKKEEVELDEAKGTNVKKFVKNMRVAKTSNPNMKGTVVKGGDNLKKAVEVEWDSGTTTMASGKYLMSIKKEEVERVDESNRKMQNAMTRLVVQMKKQKKSNSAIIKALEINFPSSDPLKFLANFKNEKVKESVEYVDEKLSPSMGAGAYVKDFKDSDAPQFKGKSKEKKQKMAIAAYLAAKRGEK